MAFILRWTNPNKLAVTTNIYRDDKALVAGALPAPIATLTAGETQWRDTTAVPGKSYFYQISTTAKNKTVFAPQQQYTIAVKRGIGPMGFLWGNDELGYMGTVPYAEQMNQSQFPQALQELIATAFADRCPMLKFSYQGRILYVFDRYGGYINGSTTWATLYQSGLIYGTDDNGPEGNWGKLTPTKQDAKVLHNNDVYRIRCPRGLTVPGDDLLMPFNLDWDTKNHSSIVPALGYNEFNDIIMSSFSNFPPNRRCPATRIVGAGYLGSVGIAPGNASFGVGVACQERDTQTNKVLRRGRFYQSSSETIRDAMEKINYGTPDDKVFYFPIFELVE